MSAFEIDIAVEDQKWSEELPEIHKLANAAIKACLDIMESEKRSVREFDEISLAFFDDERVRALNKQYRGQDKPTNVLSFPAVGPDGQTSILGDVVLAFETVSFEAQNRSIPLSDHVTHLIVHGFYHLQGLDHEDDEGATEMEALEIRTLEVLGISNPYVKEDKL